MQREISKDYIEYLKEEIRWNRQLKAPGYDPAPLVARPNLTVVPDSVRNPSLEPEDMTEDFAYLEGQGLIDPTIKKAMERAGFMNSEIS